MLTLLGTIHDAYKQVEARPDAVVSAREICKQDTLKQAILFDPKVPWTIEKAADYLKVSERSVKAYLSKLDWHVIDGIIKPTGGAK